MLSPLEFDNDFVLCLSQALNCGLESVSDMGRFVRSFVESLSQVTPHEFECTCRTDTTDLEKAI